MRDFIHVAYRLAFALCFTAFIILSSFAFAQTNDPQLQDPAPTEQVQPSAQLEPIVDKSPNPTISQVDLDDPAIQAALEERDRLQEEQVKADRALADAIEAQRQKSQTKMIEGSDVDARKTLFPTSAEDAKALAQKILDKIIGWLTSISFLAQVGAIVAAYLISPIIAGIVRKKLFLFNQAPSEETKLRIVRDYIYRSREFLRAVFLVALLALFAVILKAVPAAGQDWLVKLAQGLAVVFLLYKAIKTFIPNELVRKLATWITLPLALLGVFGYFDDLTAFLKGAELLRMGDTPITLMTVVQLAIFGAIFFKLGGIVNNKGQTAIRSQESLDSSTVEVVSKIFQILLFGLIFILVMGAAKVPMSGLVMIFSALSLGIGLGLQPVAANFVSGMIILFDRSVRVGDFVSLDDDREGFVEAINMRSTVVETTDGKDIMVPNTTFIENAYENWTHKDPRQRYEVYFTVPYDTDIDLLEDIIIPEISAHPSVLQEPEEPDLELREFGPAGINFAVEFWCSGIDDGPNKFTSDLNFAIWRILKKNGIRMPLPQTEIRMLK